MKSIKKKFLEINIAKTFLIRSDKKKDTLLKNYVSKRKNREKI